MVIVRPINLNVSYKLHLYSLQRARSPPEPHLLSCRVLALQSVVAGSISSGGDHGIHCRWDLIWSKQLSSIFVCCGEVFAGLSGHSNSIHNIIPLLKKKKKNIHLYPCLWGHNNYTDAYFLILLGRCGPYVVCRCLPDFLVMVTQFTAFKLSEILCFDSFLSQKICFKIKGSISRECCQGIHKNQLNPILYPGRRYLVWYRMAGRWSKYNLCLLQKFFIIWRSITCIFQCEKGDQRYLKKRFRMRVWKVFVFLWKDMRSKTLLEVLHQM